MTNNPADGEFQVVSLDAAQLSRFFTFHVKYNSRDWAEQAEKERIPGPFINFILKESDQLFTYVDERDKTKGMVTSPRQWSMLFNSLLNLRGDFTSTTAKFQIQQNGKAILPEEFVSLFTTFLTTKDWEMVEPEEIFSAKNEKDLLEKLRACVGVLGKDFKHAQASILSIRVINYLASLTDDRPFTQENAKRLQFIMENKIIGDDLSFKVLRDLCQKNRKKFSKLFEIDYFRQTFLS